jgi:hypothetical protein
MAKYTAKKLNRGFYAYRGFFLLRFRTKQFSRNYRSAPKSALIQGKPEWHVFNRYLPELDEGRKLEAGCVTGCPVGMGIVDKTHSVFGLETGEGLDTLQEAKEWVDDLLWERSRRMGKPEHEELS